MATAGFNSVGAVIGGAPKFSPAGMIGLKPQAGILQQPPTPALPPHPAIGTLGNVKSQKIGADGSHAVTYDTGTPKTSGAITKNQSGITPGAGYKVDPNNPNGVVADKPEAPTPTATGDNPGMINVGGTPANTQTPPDTTYPGMIGGAVSAAQGNQAIGQSAKDIANKYSGLISNEQQNLAGQLGGIETSGTTLQTALGREGVLNRTSLARQQALGTQMGYELQGTGQQLTAQQQQQSGMISAAGLTPEALRYGSQFGGGVASPSNVKSVQDLTTANNNMQATANGAEANMKLAIDTARQGGVNDTSVPFLNAAKQKFGVGFESSPAVINFRATLGAVRSMYASILGGGESTDQTRATASSLVPDDISLDALGSLATQLKSEVQNRISGNNEAIKNISTGGNVQGNQPAQTTSNAGSYTSKSGTTYNLPY